MFKIISKRTGAVIANCGSKEGVENVMKQIKDKDRFEVKSVD